MMDCHTHILFGVDDGAKTLEESLAMLQLQYDFGHQHVYLTPHVNHPFQKVTREQHHQNFQKLQQALTIPVQCTLWAEIYVGYTLPDLLWDDYLVHGCALLLETSPQTPIPLLDHCFELIQRGYRIILAHIERYAWLSWEDLQTLKEWGVLFQGNRRSFLEKKHPTHAQVIRLWTRGYVDMWASESHDLTLRAPLKLPPQLSLEELLARPF